MMVVTVRAVHGSTVEQNSSLSAVSHSSSNVGVSGEQ